MEVGGEGFVSKRFVDLVPSYLHLNICRHVNFGVNLGPVQMGKSFEMTTNDTVGG